MDRIHCGQDLRVVDDLRDAYDRDDTRYLIARERGTRPLRASARLLPTTAPHLMGDLFAHTCPGGPPAGDTVWEASRFCTAFPAGMRIERVGLVDAIDMVRDFTQGPST